MRVKIYTIAYNKPEFIEIQFKALNAFMTDGFHYIVMNNAANWRDRRAIEVKCKELRIDHRHIVDPDHSTANVSHSYSLQQTFDRYITRAYNGISVIIDCDLFPIRPLSIIQLMDGFEMSAVSQVFLDKRIEREYHGLRVVFIAIDSSMIPGVEYRLRDMNFRCGHIEGTSVDVGGMFYHYLRSYPDTKINWVGPNHMFNDRDYTPELGGMGKDYEVEFQSELIGDMFFHYRNSGNWFKTDKDIINRKEAFLNKLIDYKISTLT